MPGGLVEVGFVGKDHIEVGLVVEGRIAVNLCPLFQLCHTWPSSAQHCYMAHTLLLVST